MKVNLSTQLGEQTITQRYLFIYKKAREEKNQSLLGEQGVCWRAITKESQASTHKEKGEVERQMD